MIRAFAKLWAKWRYLWKQEVDAATVEINALATAARADEKRLLMGKLTAQADATGANIKKVAAEDAKELTGQEKYESDKERKEAEKMAEDNRAKAKELATDIQGHEDTATMFHRQAAQTRDFADLLQKL